MALLVLIFIVLVALLVGSTLGALGTAFRHCHPVSIAVAMVIVFGFIFLVFGT